MSNSCIIIGATSGIGEQLASALKNQGWSLHLVGRDSSTLQEKAHQLESSYTVADVSSFEQAENVFSEAKEHMGDINGVVNCAGSVLLKPAHLTSENDFHQTISQNLTTAFSITRAAAKNMQQGSIVLFSTAAVRIGLPNHEAIAAAKGGVEGLVRATAATYAGRGLRVNAVAPGLTRTNLTKRITDNEASLKSSASMHALGRIGEPEEVAEVARWLLQPEQSWMTGQIIACDGGLSTIHAR